jgi:hypothetical protein
MYTVESDQISLQETKVKNKIVKNE